MKNRVVAVLGLFLALGLLTPFVTGPRVLAQELPECRGLQAYVDQYHAVGQEYQAALVTLDTSNVENWTPEDFLAAHAAVDAAIAGVSALTPTPIVVEMQAQATTALELFKEMLTVIETDGVFAAFDYIDRINAAGDQLDAIVIPIEERCQVAILDNDDDGTPEIGSGGFESADIDPSATLGAYNNPFPIGTSAATEGGWTIQVDSVTPDGTQAVLAENQFNEAPEPGQQFFIATITATYNGTGTATFDGNFRLRVRGADGTIYTAFGNPCGVTPNEWDQDLEAASGQSLTGNLCWSVPTDQLTGLRMFDKEAENAGGLLYWSLGQDGI